MGTAALDRALSLSQSQTQHSALDKALALSKNSPTQPQQEVQPESTWDTLGDYAKFMFNLAKSPYGFDGLFNPSSEEKSRQRDLMLSSAKQLGINIGHFAVDVGDLIQTKPQDLGKVFNKIKGSDLIQNPIKGAFLGLASLPVSVAQTITGTSMGSDGSVIPATPEQEAQNLQTTVATVAAGAVAGRIGRMLEGNVIRTVAAPGNLIIKSGLIRGAQGLGAGATFGAVSGMGDENQAAQVIGDALSFAAIGALWRPFKGARELNEAINNNKAKVDASQISAIRGLQITPDDSPLEIASKTKAFAVGFNALDAWVNNNLTIGKQVIVQDVPESVIKQLENKYKPTVRTTPGIYNPTVKVDKPLVYRRIALDVTDPFDRNVLISEKNSQVLEDIKKQTGLNEDEITSHRKYIKDQIKTLAADKNNITPKNPLELQVAEQAAIDKGKALVENLGDGETITGGDGSKWTRFGTNLTNGVTSLPINSPAVFKLVGTDQSFDPNARMIRVPKQNFSPNYGRELSSKVSAYKFGDTHLLSSYPLADEDKAFFEKSGYLPNEMVSIHGDPYAVKDISDKGYIKAQSIATGNISKFFPSELRRLAKGLDSEFYKASNGEQLARMGIYNKDTYFDNLYDKFKSGDFKLDEIPNEPFSKTMVKFAKSIGMTNVDDIDDLGKSFYHRAIMESLDDEDTSAYQNAIKNIEKWQSSIQESKVKNLHFSLKEQNMSLTHRGGSLYDIKDMQTGQIMSSVRNLDDALDFTNKTAQAKGLDLDGGMSNGQPIIGGNLLDDFTPSSNKVADWLDAKVNAGRPSRFVVRSRSAIDAIERVSGIKFNKYFVATQYAQNIMSNLASSPIMVKMSDAFNKTIESGNKLDLDRRIKVYRDMGNYSTSDIISKFRLNSDDQNAALQISKTGSGDVIDFIHDVREGSDYKPVTSDSFKSSLKAEINKGKYDKTVMDVATNLMNGFNGDPKNVGILKLAQNLEFGEHSETLTQEERNYKTALTRAHEAFPGTTDPFYAYLAHSKLAEMVGYNPFSGHSPELLRDFNKNSSTPSNQLELDPNTILSNLRRSSLKSARIITEDRAFFNGVNNKISFNEVTRRTQDFINSLHPLEKDDENTQAEKAKNAPYVQYLTQYLSDVKGVPDISEQMGRRAELAIKEMYPDSKKSPELVRLGSSLVYSSLLGLRSAFALRDLWNAHQNVYIFAGAKAALKVFGGVFSRETAQSLMDDGEIPATKGLDMLNPGENIIEGMGRLSKVAGVADKLSEWATKLNGQQLAHVQANTGIWMYYWKQVGELSDQMIKGDITKEKAYKQLKISKISPTEQSEFDNLIKAGKVDQAGRYLARSMVDRFNVVYGRNNAPQAWKSWFGKLAGGFGQWTTNQINTNIDQLTRGTRRDILESAGRMLVSNAAIWGAGALTGLNLSRWMINPLSLPSESPLMAGLIGGAQDAENATSVDPAISNPSGSKLFKMLPYNNNWAHLYIPFSFFLQNELDAYNMANGDFGPVAPLKALTGISTINSTVSPLQKMLDLRPEWKDRAVPDKGMGNTGVGNIFEGRSIIP